MSLTINKGSYRDPKGHVFHFEGKVLRTINQSGVQAYDQFKTSKLFKSCQQNHWLPLTKEINKAPYDKFFDGEQPEYLLQHESIPFISYPYEWSFSLLKAAALFHLRLHLLALKEQITLTDASAFNVQFIGHTPIFIDILSFTPYQEGQYWVGHRQFCEQFLFPLLLRSQLGIAHNSLFRGNLEGISLTDMVKLLPIRSKLSLNILLHIYLPYHFQKKFTNAPIDTYKSKASKVKLSLKAHIAMLERLQSWIEKLKPQGTLNIWGNYENDNSYSSREENNKKNFIKQFLAQTTPTLLFDLGCNSGEYAQLSLENGTDYVVGFDACHTALEKSYQRSVKHNLNFLPLYMDLTNPSPDLGWQQQERSGFYERSKPNAILALALLHHIVIGRNVPLESAAAWLVNFAPTGVIEFIPKTSPVMQKMLMTREDIFPNYTEEQFEFYLSKYAKVIDRQVISSDNRVLYWFQR